MWRIGMTGSIATGKSTVLKAFADLGVPVFSADEAVAELYAGEAVAPVEALFPGVTRNGAIDRAALSQILAADPSGFRRLEAVVHPLVRARIARFMDEAEAAGHELAVVEVPLLFESGYDYGFDAIAVTWVDEAIQRQRALARPGMTVEKLDTILARQLPQAEKKARATYLFDTSMPIARTVEMVAALVAAIKARGPSR
ncbi:MAG: dephospho-CoA kinase [Alphaproteobacteria bacterium]|nr:dephospho-CoA kinase [Alphaproteobacteria bacterium]MBU1562092.1 dephospho-CoA kinase [Alphaproteobacteria bacterium]MBU2301793.1 dephospho-CoA kinase [Alphaproteobacteria bacterium]MBU2369621.1 dephospho-CoA kinase [Alphaproteobacteria bacterium]